MYKSRTQFFDVLREGEGIWQNVTVHRNLCHKAYLPSQGKGSKHVRDVICENPFSAKLLLRLSEKTLFPCAITVDSNSKCYIFIGVSQLYVNITLN